MRSNVRFTNSVSCQSTVTRFMPSSSFCDENVTLLSQFASASAIVWSLTSVIRERGCNRRARPKQAVSTGVMLQIGPANRLELSE